MSSYKFRRRSFLQGLGGSAALLVPLLRSIEARAAGAAAPLRLLIIQHPLGCTPYGVNWVPKGVTTTTSNFTGTLPLETAPFQSLMPYMCMVDGVNMVTSGTGNDATGGANTHEGGMVALMTGVPTCGMVGQQDHCAGGPSIEQLFLQKSAVLGGVNTSHPTPFTGGLQLAADIRSDRDEIAPRTLSYGTPIAGQSQPDQIRNVYAPLTSPLQAFGQYFGGSVTGDAGAGMGSNQSAQLLANNKSIVNYLQGDLKRMQGLVPSSENDRLAAHAQAILSLEASIQQAYGMKAGGDDGGASVCVQPAQPPNFSNTSSGTQHGGDDCTNGSATTSLAGVDYFVPNAPTSHPFLTLGQTQLQLIKTAFLCDLFRVATFLWTAGTNWVVFPGEFQNATVAGNLQSTPHHPVSHTTNPATQAWLDQINNFFSQATAAVLQDFASTPDIDGNMLIDNTVIVYVTEVARAHDHDQHNLPVLVFGGKNTGINGGTILKVKDGPLKTQFADGGAPSGVTGTSTGNRPLNDVWLALAPIFGVTMTSLGSESGYSGSAKAPQSTGPCPGIVKA